MSKKVYIFLADGFEDIEGLTVVDLMRRAGIDIETVSIKESNEITTSHGIMMKTDRVFTGTDFSDADMLDLLRDFYGKSGKVAAICAAPTVLASLGFLEGRKATAYPSCMEGLTGAEPSYESVVVDGNVTTSRGLGTAVDFALSLIGQLLGEEKADEIAESVVYSRK